MFKPTQTNQTERAHATSPVIACGVELKKYLNPNDEEVDLRTGRTWKMVGPNEPTFPRMKGWNGGASIDALSHSKHLNALSTRSRLESFHPNMMDYLTELHKSFLQHTEDGLAETARLELPDQEWIDWAKARPHDSARTYTEGILPLAKWSNSAKHNWASYLIPDSTAQVRRMICDYAITNWNVGRRSKHDLNPGLVEIFRVAHIESTDQVYLHPQGCFLNIQPHKGRDAVGGVRAKTVGPETRHRRYMPTEDEYLSPFTLLALHKSMIEAGSNHGYANLRYGDYVVALRTSGEKQHIHEFEKDSAKYNMILGSNGVYDWVKTDSRSAYKIDFVAVPMEEVWEKVIDVGSWSQCRDETVAMAMLSVVASATLNMVGDDSSSIPDDVSRFVPTWKDRRKVKERSIGTFGNEYKHDLIRCSMCNGATIIKAPLANRESKADCPHCEAKETLLFPHLVDGGDIQRIFPRKESS